MPQTEIFKDNVTAGGVVKPTSKVKFKFELNEGVSPDQIEYIKTDCGSCTKAELKGDAIVGEVDMSKAMMNYESGKTPVNRTIRVFIKDGQSEFIPDEKTKIAKFNTDKKIERLTVAAIVEKE